MKNNKKIVAITLMGSMLISNGVFAKSFKDVTSTNDYKWVYNSVDFLSNRGVFGGYPDGTFKPQKAVSFLEVLQVIKTMKNPSADELKNARDSYLKKVRAYKVADWGEDAVCYNLSINTITLETLKAASSRGFMKDYAMVYPDRNTITVYFGRAFGFSNIGDESLLKHKDIDKINPITKGYLATFVEAGIYSDTGINGNFKGSKYVSRSEIAVIAEKIIKYMEGNGTLISKNPEAVDLIGAEKPKEQPVETVKENPDANVINKEDIVRNISKSGIDNVYKIQIGSAEYLLDMNKITSIWTNNMTLIHSDDIESLVGRNIVFSSSKGEITDIRVMDKDAKVVVPNIY